MKKKKKWEATPLGDGVCEFKLSAWKYFADLINNDLLDYPGYIYRGQCKANWLLESTLDRLIKKLKKTDNEEFQRDLLDEFEKSTRGRLNQNRDQLKPNDWWALGQHHGLATPLLDWTMSPYIAAFFAYNEETEGEEDVAVWALQEYYIIKKSKELIPDDCEDEQPKSMIEIFHPLTDENKRLISQAGLFTRAPFLVDLEKWVRNQFKGEDKETILFKILLPKKDREAALKSLNRMQVNYLTLFPDLEGSSKHCIMKFSIEAY